MPVSDPPILSNITNDKIKKVLNNEIERTIKLVTESSLSVPQTWKIYTKIKITLKKIQNL